MQQVASRSRSLHAELLRRSRSTRKECVGPRNVLAIPRFVLLQGLLEQRDPGDSHQKNGNRRWPDHGPPCSTGRNRNHVQAPPDEEVTEVVGMPGITPQTNIEDSTGVGRICLVPSQLPVADRFEKKA